MELWELEARESIRDLVARYNANGDSGRIDAMAELFADDAVMVIAPDAEHEGRKAIHAFFSGVASGTRDQIGSGVRFIRHYTATHQIDVLSPTEARGRCYYAVLTDRGLDHWGRYIDEYRRIDGRWRFWRRTCTTDARVDGSWAQASSERRDR
jgi:uncharacterized protein (TIGR02246 family)